MKLYKLTPEELSELFLQISKKFLNTATGQPSDFTSNDEFLRIRQELHDLMDELARRREKAAAIAA